MVFVLTEFYPYRHEMMGKVSPLSLFWCVLCVNRLFAN